MNSINYDVDNDIERYHLTLQLKKRFYDVAISLNDQTLLLGFTYGVTLLELFKKSFQRVCHREKAVNCWAKRKEV